MNCPECQTDLADQTLSCGVCGTALHVDISCQHRDAAFALINNERLDYRYSPRPSST
jgi:hypothetical protein